MSGHHSCRRPGEKQRAVPAAPAAGRGVTCNRYRVSDTGGNLFAQLQSGVGKLSEIIGNIIFPGGFVILLSLTKARPAPYFLFAGFSFWLWPA